MLTLNEGSSHNLEAVPRRDHRDRAAFEVRAELAELDEAVLLLLVAAELMDEGIPAEEVERVAEARGAGSVDGEHVDLVRVVPQRRGERVGLVLSA